MSQETNTNIAATDAANNLTQTEQSMSQSILGLSAGLRINQQILQQAGISTLAQAQRPPQAVMPLLN